MTSKPNGRSDSVAQVISVTLNLSAEVTDVGANACVVVQAEGRLVGIYEPDGRDLPA